MKKSLMTAVVLIIVTTFMLGCVPQKSINNDNNNKHNNISQSHNPNKTEKSTVIQPTKPESAKSDTFPVEEVVRNYEKLMIEAINNNDFSLIQNLLIPNSNLYNSQKKLVYDLYNKNIKEQLNNFDIKDIQSTGQNGYYKVYVTENIGVKYPGKQEFQANNYNWIYTVIKDDKGVGLSDIEKWEK